MNTTLTPTARLENQRDAALGLSAAVDSLAAQPGLATTTSTRLDALRAVLIRTVAQLEAAVDYVGDLAGTVGSELDHRCKRFATIAVELHQPWLDLAETELDQAVQAHFWPGRR